MYMEENYVHLINVEAICFEGCMYVVLLLGLHETWVLLILLSSPLLVIHYNMWETSERQKRTHEYNLQDIYFW